MIWNRDKTKTTKRSDTKRQPTGFTMLLIPNSSDAAKTIEISYDRLLQLLSGAVAIGIIIVGLMGSMIYHNHKLKNSLDAAEQSVNELNESNTELEETVSVLNDQIEADKEVFSKIEDTISKREEEEVLEAEQAAIPNEIPVKNARAILVDDPYKDSNGGQTNGIVFSTIKGAVVAAAAEGVVTHVDSDDENPFYNRGIVIDHENGYVTYYRLNGDVSIEEGSTVMKNDVLAVLTEDGYIAYEIKQNGEFIDPRSMIVQD